MAKDPTHGLNRTSENTRPKVILSVHISVSIVNQGCYDLETVYEAICRRLLSICRHNAQGCCHRLNLASDRSTGTGCATTRSCSRSTWCLAPPVCQCVAPRSDKLCRRPKETSTTHQILPDLVTPDQEPKLDDAAALSQRLSAYAVFNGRKPASLLIRVRYCLLTPLLVAGNIAKKDLSERAVSGVIMR